jgi:hypothetical protein
MVLDDCPASPYLRRSWGVELPSVAKARARIRPVKSPKTAKRRKTAEELEQLLAERAGVPAVRVSVFGAPGNWNAALIAPLVGNAERLARFRSLVGELQRDYD